MTSHVCSNVAKCDIYIHPIPTKPIAVERVVRVNRTTVFLDAKGRIYCTSIQDGFAFTTAWSDRQQFQDLYQALVKLGKIPKEDVEAHLAEAKRIGDRIEARSAARAVLDNAVRCGLKLTAAQKAKLETLSPEKKNV